MEYVIFDLEWNGGYSHKRDKIFNEVIEIGAVKLSESLEIIDKFSMLIKPQVNKRITRNIQNLTHIRNEDLKTANTFGHVYKMFGKFVKDCVLMSWGEVDIITLTDNCDYFTLDRDKINTDKYVDLQKYCQVCLGIGGKDQQLGLTSAALELSLNLKNVQLHRALSDSLLAAWCFQKIYDEKKFNNSIIPLDEEFYKRITFKSVFITSINNPLVKKSYLQVKCKHCGRFLKRTSDWQIKNKGFKADFNCKLCKVDFDVRIKIKSKYEGVIVNKTLNDIIDEEETINQESENSKEK